MTVVRLSGTSIALTDERHGRENALANANAVRGLRGRQYGEVSPEAERTFDGIVSETQALVREPQHFLAGVPMTAGRVVAGIVTGCRFSGRARSTVRVNRR